MATPEERLVAIEVELRQLGNRVDELLQVVNSGPSVPWAQSIRGRLHSMRSSLLAAEQLAEAAREVRRSQRRQWSRFERGALLVVAVAGAAAPYIVLFFR